MNEEQKLNSDYEFVGPIQVNTDDLNKISVFDSPMSENNQRQDKGTLIDGKRSSNIMFGYNKEGIILENGTYVSKEKFLEALNKEVSTYGENEVIVVKKTNKVVKVDKVIKDIIKSSNKDSKLKIENGSEKIRTKNSSVFVQGKNDFLHHFKKKGNFITGSKIQLPNGEYITQNSIQEALSNYMRAEKKESVEEVEILENTKKVEASHTNTRKKVIKVKKEKHNIIAPICAAVMATVVLMTGIKNVNTTNYITEQVPTNTVVMTIQTDEKKNIEETKDMVQKRISSKFIIGEKRFLSTGQEFHESSDYKNGGANKTGTVGETLRPEGNYTMDKIQLLYNGEFVKGAGSAKEGVTAEQLLEYGKERFGLDSYDQLTVMVHFTGERAGWIDMMEVATLEEKQPQMVEVATGEKEEYTIVNDDYDGKSFTKMIEGEKVNVSSITEGETIKSEDGKEYKIIDSNVSKTTKEETKEVVTQEQKLSIDKENFTPLDAAGTLAVAAVTYALTKKKREYEVEIDEGKDQKEFNQNLEDAYEKEFYDKNHMNNEKIVERENKKEEFIRKDNKLNQVINKISGKQPNKLTEWKLGDKLNKQDSEEKFKVHYGDIGHTVVSEVYEQETTQAKAR